MGEERAIFDLLTGSSQFEPLIHGTEPIASPETMGVIDAATFAINRVIRSEDDRQSLFDEVQVNNAAEGSGIPIIMGPNNSIKGQWLWISNIFPRLGDLGESLVDLLFQTDIETYYDAVFAMSVGMTAVPGRSAKVERIFTDGKETWNELFFQTFGQVVVQGNDIAVENATYNNRDVLRLTSVTTDFGQFFQNGVTGVQTEGFTNGANNRDSGVVNIFSQVNRLIRIVDNGNGSWTMDLLDPANTAVDESAGNTITLTQDFADWDTLLNGRIWTQVGFFGISPNPSLNVNKFDGVNNEDTSFADFLGYSPVVLKPDHPAYKRLVWFYGQMGLSDFNNRIPDVRCHVKEITGELNNQKPIGDAIADIMNLAGYDACEYDTDGLSGNLRGYTIYPPANGAKALRPIMEGYNITPYEDWGKLWFINRGSENIVTLESGKMGAHEPGSDVPRPLLLTQESDFEQPSAVTVKYLDTTLDMQQSAETVRRHNVDVEKVLEVELPLSLTPTEARTIGNRVLWNAWQNSTKITIHLPPMYLYLHEQHKIQLVEDGRSYNFIVTDIEEGSNFILEVTGFIESLNPFDETILGEVSNPGGIGIYLPPFMELFAHDLAPMAQSIVDQPRGGFYVQTAALDPSAEFIGASLWCNYIDLAIENYEVCAGVISEASMGFSTTSLADAPVANTSLWDRSSSVTVQMFQGTLASQTENKILRAWGTTDGFRISGANIARLGDEIFGFTSVVNNGDGTFTLSNLLRGLRNTLDATGGHSSGEEFHLVTSVANNLFIPMSDGQYQGLEDVRLRSVPFGGDPQYTEVHELTFAKGLREPFTVALQGHRGYNYLNTTADDDEITVAWFPRMRGFMSMFGEWYRDEDNPTSGAESYGFIFRADDTANTILASKADSYTPDTGDSAYKGYRITKWTEAEQTTTAVAALGHSLGDPVIVEVFKTVIGYNGKISSVTIT